MTGVFGVFSTASAASFIVEERIGTAYIYGFLITDGTIGTLATENIVNWHLTMYNGPNEFIFVRSSDPAKPSNSTMTISGDVLSTAGPFLFFNSAEPSGYALFQGIGANNGYSWCLNAAGCLEADSPGFTATMPSLAQPLVSTFEAKTYLGHQGIPEPAMVPLPAALPLLFAAIGGLGGMHLIGRRGKATA
ncbi:hypothetical protein BV911_14125 [Pseudoruegeria sp. SK021]|nr:hypothetical protein BV911_14125 [Pseudoruegeria sp. SK021]